jgi:hypothetical protein
MPDAVIPADRITRVSDAKLKDSQFADRLRDQHGEIRKPPEWVKAETAPQGGP